VSTHDPAPSNPTFRLRGPSAVLRMALLIVFAAVIAVIAFVGETLGHSHSSAGAATITVTGSGTVTGTPNTVSFQIGVSTTARSAAAALRQNNVKTSAMEHSLLTNGVTKKNLQTSDLSIYDNTNSSGAVISFTVSDQLTVTMHDLAKAGAAIDAASNTAGNGVQFSGVSFSISNQSKYLARARTKAMQNARLEASQIARGGGTSLGSIVKVTDHENTGSTGIILPFTQFASAAAKSVPIESGSQSLNVQVTVVYALAS